ncbi:MAG: cation-translocating P-type ATPase [Anaerolineae bacterium]
MSEWYRLEREEVLARLETDLEQGLDQAEAQRRLAEYGPNELVERGTKSPWLILWEQTTALLVIILIVAAVVSVALGDFKDAVAILAIVVLNTVLGFTQEYRAEQAMAALKKLAVPTVRVRRDGRLIEISARELVPGDIVQLEAGAFVPADGRVLESVNLRTEEAALTGESEPVDKYVTRLSGDDLPLGDRRNMVYMGTVVSYGRGTAVITETGMNTELGHIADMIQTVEQEQTPLQRRLDQLGRGLALAALVIVAVVFILGLLRGENWRLMLLTAISMAVAVVPEGLPAVVTIGLALGAQRMLKRKALIRKLPAVETLGSVTTICSDKTGTLTENRMTVTVLDVMGETQTVETMLRHRVPVLDLGRTPGVRPQVRSLRLLVIASALCNDAVLEADMDGDRYRAIGDPTEGALVLAAAQLGFRRHELDQRFPRVAEIPFTSERKRMTTVHQVRATPDETDIPCQDVPYVAFCKGAVDGLLELTSQVWSGDEAVPLTEELRGRIEAANERLAKDGQRVLGVAFRPLSALPESADEAGLERDLTFIGLVGMMDPPRPEVKHAVDTCRAAGIRPVMITGDHPLTANHIAHELKIAINGQVLTGQDLARLSVEELETVVEDVPVYARVSPEHKLKIVQALQDRGHIVAMTGDGVNDAPALRKADIGVAMGITGTDVAKEAADMVLLDDNFATIVAAVEEGRTIYDNIRKFIKYTLTSNAGELLVMLLAPFLGLPLPLLPLQILWINLVTDGLPGLALTLEPAERGTMRRPPYSPQESIFGRGLGRDIVWVGLLMALVSLGVGYWGWSSGNAAWQTIIFTTLVLSQLGNALALRSERESLFSIGLLSNRAMLGTLLLTFGLQLAVVYVPFLQAIFKTQALSPRDLVISLVLSTVVFWGVETKKLLFQWNAQ